MYAYSLVTFLSVIALGACASLTGDVPHGRCEPITIPICREIPYNTTIFPNLMGHTNQDDANNEVYQYFPLVKVNCSADILLFLCSMYAPVCTILERPLQPCRSLCESARQCEKLMQKFGFPWPQSFECSKFPIGATVDDLCVGENRGRFGDPELERVRTTTLVPSRPSDFSDMMDFICPAALKTPTDYEYQLVSLHFTKCSNTASRFWRGNKEINFAYDRSKELLN